MLRELYIENFALVDKLTINFGDGLNILTGETGAGKSIIIDALSQVLGDRASADLVRSNCERAVISASFAVTPAVCRCLQQLGLDGSEETVVLQKEITATGKSQARVDGRPVSAAVLRQVGSLLAEIHGQHQHQDLLNPAAHLRLLDAFGGQPVLNLAAAYRQQWDKLVQLKAELASLHGDKRERERMLDLLQYQVDEIDQANLVPEEEQKLQAERKMLQNARQLLELCQQGYQLLYQGEDSPVVQVLAALVDGLKAFRDVDTTLEQACTQLEESLYNVEDVARQLRSFADDFEFEPGRLAEVEERLDLINDLKRKYADTIPGILAWRDEKAREIEAIKNTAARHGEITRQIQEVLAEAGQTAVKLSQLRQQVAEKLARAVEAELEYLQMARTRFEVEFGRRCAEDGLPVDGQRLAADSDGIDQVQFLLSPNPGEPLKPLAKIASGGEMSRIMLAILNVLADVQPVATLVFDEIDAGIGGRAAQAVAEKLAAVALSRQIICVSHLPQVSSMADNHYQIFKEQAGSRTLTRVRRLDMAGRIDELARMLGGAEVTQATRRHASEMLKLAAQVKASF